MPRIPTHRKQRLPSTNVGAAPVPIGAAFAGSEKVGQGIAALGAGVSNLGSSLAQIAGANNKALDTSASVKQDQALKEAELDYQKAKLENADPDSWPEARKAAYANAEAKMKEIKWGTSRSKELAAVQFGAYKENRDKATAIDVLGNNIKAAEVDSEGAYIANPTPENLTRYKDSLKATTHPDLIDDKVKEATQNATALQIKGGYQRIIIDGGTKKEGRELIESALKKGSITPDQGQVLNSGLNSFVAGTAREQTATTEETYNEFSDTVLTGTMNMKDVQNSPLSDKDKKKWIGYIDGSREPAPLRSEAEGSRSAWNAVFGFIEGRLDQQESQDKILTSMFIDGDMNNKDYNWAMGKLKEPYDQYVAGDMQQVALAVRDKWQDKYSDKELDTVHSLFQWVDAQIASGKTPTKKEMNVMADQFHVRGVPLVDVGQTVRRGDRDYEVIGFDEDGEPMVEPLD